jgi:hypothetical protein
MAHFAKVINGVVTQVIVAESEFFESFVDTSPGEWIQTSYNTHGGVHLNGGTPLRMNFAGVGFTYNKDKDVFISPKIYNSWVLNEDSCLWEPPIPVPSDNKKYFWNEQKISWEEVLEEN